MASTILELTRSSHEQVERLERLIVKELINNNYQQRRQSSTHHHHLIRNMIDHIKSTTHKLIEFYQDQDSAMKDEIAMLGSSSEDHVFGLFYDRAKEITQFHRRRPHHHPAPPAIHENCDDQDSELLQQMMTKWPSVFSGEEGYGRYLDLHELYNDYINSIYGEKHIDYLSYLQVFSLPIPGSLKLKSKRQYREYLNKLLGYLASFLERTQPLLDLERLLSMLTIEFQEQWRQINHDSHNDLHSANINIDLDSCTTAEELLQLAGPDKLKEALAALGLKTGGTVHQLAHRLFLTKRTHLDQLDTRHFACTSEDIALTEAKVEKLCELLQETIIRTQQYVEKKQALTYSEMEAEREEMIEEVRGDGHNINESEEEEQHEQEATPIISNPLKLPMGWDGKPIPYWLYKLNGLGNELKCEICGDHSYRGRRAYERHFKEFRHQQGMRRLGIQNTNDFNEITSIEEARQLWKRIKQRQSANKWEPDLEEEYEDQEGNIYPRKTYTDLQRQGLI